MTLEKSRHTYKDNHGDVDLNYAGSRSRRRKRHNLVNLQCAST